jgi:hypothetical protein
MSATKTRAVHRDAQRTCKAARQKMRAALTELARFHSQPPMSRDAFAAWCQRIADEHAKPRGCELLVQHNADGLVKVRIKAQECELPCEVCQTIECFFNPRTY